MKQRSLACWLLGVWALTAACSRSSERQVYVSELEQAHSAADHAATEGETRSALRSLERAFELSPEGNRETTLSLRQDLADRIARLHLRLGEAQTSLEWARKGLTQSDRNTVLRATLLITEADALEALGERDQARDRLMSALEINQALLHVELEEP